MWCVYILRCNDGSYYTGVSSNVEKRLKQHNDGKGAEYTKARRPVTLVYFKEFVSRHEAETREIEIKGYNRAGKERVIKFCK
jgi:putative endonuclease